MCHPQLTTTFPPHGQTPGPVELLELRVRVCVCVGRGYTKTNYTLAQSCQRVIITMKKETSMRFTTDCVCLNYSNGKS